jgi:hypothetical protein
MDKQGRETLYNLSPFRPADFLTDALCSPLINNFSGLGHPSRVAPKCDLHRFV